MFKKTQVQKLKMDPDRDRRADTSGLTRLKTRRVS
jgi:hypothetical protein